MAFWLSLAESGRVWQSLTGLTSDPQNPKPLETDAFLELFLLKNLKPLETGGFLELSRLKHPKPLETAAFLKDKQG